MCDYAAIGYLRVAIYRFGVATPMNIQYSLAAPSTCSVTVPDRADPGDMLLGSSWPYQLAITSTTGRGRSHSLPAATIAPVDYFLEKVAVKSNIPL